MRVASYVGTALPQQAAVKIVAFIVNQDEGREGERD